MGKAVQVVTSFVSIPLTLGYLGTERMGLWRLTISLLTIISLLNAGVIPHIKTRMAEAFSRNDDKKFAEYSSTGILIGLIVIMLGILAVLLTPSVDWVNLMKVTDPIAQQEALPLVMVIVACTFTNVGTSFIPVLFDARMQVSKPRIYELLGGIVGFLLLLAGIHLRVNLPWLAAMISAPGIIFRLSMLLELFRANRGMLLPHLSIAKRIVREMIRPALLAVGIQGGSIVLSAAPNFLVVRMLSLAEVTRFSICYQVASFPLIIIEAIVPVFWPAFTMTWHSGKRQKVGRLLLSICGCTAGLLLLFAIGLGIIGPWFIRNWTHGTIDPAGPFLMTLGLFVIVQGVLHWLSTFMWSLSELWIQLETQLASAAILVSLGFLLGVPFGLYGIATAMIIAITVGALGPMCWRTWKLVILR
jgi:O-antigen/teichoic acid export membrane protein